MNRVATRRAITTRAVTRNAVTRKSATPAAAASTLARLAACALLVAAALAPLARAGVPRGARARAASSRVAPAGAPETALSEALAARQWVRAESLATAGLATARTPGDSAGWIAPLLLARWRNDHESLPDNAALAERALRARLADPGPDSLPLALAYEGSAYALSGSHRSREADERVQAALAIRTRHASGPDADIIRLRHLLGVFAYQRGDHAAARERFQAEIADREAFRPLDRVELARACMSLASAQSVLGDRAASVANYQRSLALLDEAPGDNDRDRLYALSSLVVALGTADRPAEAVELAHRAVALAERTLGPDHAQTGYAHRSLGYAYTLLGDYASAREEDAHAVAVLAHALGDSNDQVAQTRRLLASAASKSGDFETSLPIAKDVLRRLEAAPEPDPVKVVDALNSVAFALNGLGRRDEAMAAFWKALGWCDRALGPTHPRTSFQMANLAGACLDAGRVDRAESLLVRARALTTARDGSRHSSQVQLLRGLAIVSCTRHRWAGADSLLDEAVSIARETSSGNPQDLEPALEDRARERADAGRAEDAVADALEAAALHRAQARLMADGLSEREALRFDQADPSGVPIAVSIAATAPLPPASRRAVWDAVIRARARVVDDMAERLHLAADPAADSLAAAFRQVSADLSAALVRGAPPARVDSLRHRRESLEVALGRASARWGGDRDEARVGFDDVRVALPAGAALVAYVRHAKGHASDAAGRITPPGGYSAFLLRAGGDEPVALSIGASAVVDSLVAAWNALASREPPADVAAAREAEARLRAVGERLRARVWDPVRARLGDASLVLVVPDGALQLVNLATLPDGRGWLVEHGPTLHVLTAERDVVRGTDAGPAGTGLLAFGAPDFDAGETSPAASGPVAFRGARLPCGRFDALRFPALPAARAEMDSVVALWRGSSRASEPARVIVGAEASEARFKREAGGHRVLHLATHGFFLDAACVRAESARRGVTALAEWSPPAPAAAPGAPRVLPGSVAGNPLMLSGLVLGGANRRGEAGAGEDGILTAQEIAALDLRGSEWAVLSACRSGVGEVQDGEGVSGLRRAFRESGVRTVIASLWPVADADAQAWMEELYRARLAGGASTASAVRAASLARLRALRARHAATLPVAWGAFLAAGDWR